VLDVYSALTSGWALPASRPRCTHCRTGRWSVLAVRATASYPAGWRRVWLHSVRRVSGPGRTAAQPAKAPPAQLLFRCSVRNTARRLDSRAIGRRAQRADPAPRWCSIAYPRRTSTGQPCQPPPPSARARCAFSRSRRAARPVGGLRAGRRHALVQGSGRPLPTSERRPGGRDRPPLSPPMSPPDRYDLAVCSGLPTMSSV